MDLEAELAIAREALGAGDYGHCAHHLANAIVEAPESLEVDDMVVRLHAGAPDPMKLVELGDGVYVGRALLRSRFLECRGRLGEAAELLLRAHAAVPHADHLRRIGRLLERPEAFNEDELEPLAAVLYPYCAELSTILVPFVESLRKRTKIGVQLGSVLARCLRIVGRLEEAVQVSRELAAREPGVLAFISLGSAEKDAGHDQEAVEAFRRLLDFDPDNVPVRLDIGDIEMKRGNFAVAERFYAEALEREPENDWALPSRLFAAWRHSGDEDVVQRLLELARESAPRSRARALADAACPYRFSLSPPDNAVMSAGRHAERIGDGLVRVAVSSMEAPSAVAALFDFVRSVSHEAVPEVGFAEVPRPDPRVPLAKVERALWSYSKEGWLARLMGTLGESARVAVPAPDPRVQDRVLQLASSSYELDAWTKEAAVIACSLAATDVDALLGCMVHVPSPPEGVDAWERRFRVQVAAALVVSFVGADWEGSARRGALHDLLLGPVDWTTAAGILATCNLARVEPALSAPVCTLLGPLLDVDGGPIHWMNISEPLARCAEWIPERSEALNRWLERTNALRAELAAAD